MRLAGVAAALAPALACSGLAIAALAPARPAQVSPDDADALVSYRLAVPVAGITPEMLRDTFYEPRGGRPHEALDIPAPRGTAVTAVGDGRIVKLFKSVPGGLTVYQFDPAERFAYYYAHLDRYAEGLREGAPVHRGEVIGYVGTTGNAPPEAPHLHFAIFRLGPEKRWWEGSPLDPYPFLRAGGASTR